MVGCQSGRGVEVGVEDCTQMAGRGDISNGLAGGKNGAGQPIMERGGWCKREAKIVRFFKDTKH